MSDLTPAQQLGRRIYAARIARGWSLHQLAAAAGVSTTPVTGLEQGREAGFSNAARIAAALGIPLTEAGRP